MSEDKETRRKLLDSARQEFLAKGYMKASLRTICKNVGVTTGALYFFFQDKEDLLKNLVEEPLNELVSMLQRHLSDELGMETAYVSLEGDSEDIRVARELVHYMYQHFDVFQILLTKSQGSAYEDIVSRFADLLEEHYSLLADQITERLGVPKPDQYMIHWLSHIQIDAFIHLLTHEPDEEKAVRHIEGIVVYLISGWNGLFASRT
ncbi:MAG: TetR/AcrR family transcriptional regulator [Eubacteriales bacterium]|nr:TetR/AcrR family transcriptional regulator [Eubacteriales bacterium]